MLKKIFFFFFLQFQLFAQTTQNLRGIVRENASNRNIAGANVQILNTNFRTQSDSLGVFRFQQIPTGRYNLQISVVGFETLLLQEILLDAAKENVLEILLTEKAQSLQEATVRAGQISALANAEVITQEQVLRFPATFLDPARLAASFAGVSNDNDQANGMVIRGNSPNLMQWRLEGVEIVNPNHLSNAGTFSDQPAQNSGGVNALSAQLLGTTHLLKGALPAQYGNALSGVMDMRFRKGNNEQQEFTAQAGLIGFDFSAEGPFSKKGKSSYLINYRYSFTGLLGAMGVSFGGEDIRFQDLSFNLSFPNKKLGDFTVFGVFGKSSNVFTSQKDATIWESEKDQFDITFRNNLFATGITHQKNINPRLSLKNVLALSGLDSWRTETAKSYYVKDLGRRETNTFLSTLSFKQNLKNTFRAGVEVNQRITDDIRLNDNIALDDWLKRYKTTWQAFSDWQYSNEKLSTQIGVRYLYGYFRHHIEPRASFQYRLKPKQEIFGAVSSQSALINSSNLIHFGLGHRVQIDPHRSLKTELFYQLPTNGFCCSLGENVIAAEINGTLNFNSTNYGIESSYQQFLDKGFYFLLNGTLYKAITKYNKTVERPSRYDGRFATNLTTGKEWARTKNRILGLNLRVIYRGGFRETPINVVESAETIRTTVFNNDINLAWSIQQANYFRPDLSVYLKKNKAGYTRTLSLDIQNVANYQNQDLSYYDHYLQKVTQRKQLGIIPVLNYRVSF